MIRIITTKKYKAMLAEIEGLRGSLLNMQNLLKGNYNKYQYDRGQMEDEIKKLKSDIEVLEMDLRRSEHQKAEALKKLKKYENESRRK
jgi:hypothetical protein